MSSVNKPRFEIRIQPSESRFEAREGQSVLKALTPVHGIEITAGCFSGGCGVCKIQVLEGEYSVGVMSKAHVSDAEAAKGYCLACKTIPKSNLVIRVLRQVPAKLGHRYGYKES